MTRILLIVMLVLPMFLMSSGCESKWGTAGLGAVGGAAATGGGYEYVAKREMDRIEADYKAGRIDQREYEIRKDQIQRMSVLK
jgi:hypothetical protein